MPGPGGLPGRSADKALVVMVLVVMVLLVTSVLGVRPAQADPDYPGPLLYGLDPVIRTTEDPRLLGVARLVLRQRLLAQGIDPVTDGTRPTLESTIRQRLLKKSGVDLKRRVELVEANGFQGLLTRFQYPEYFFLFQSPEPLPGGFTYTPPRPVDAPEVSLFVDDLDLALTREYAVQEVMTRASDLSVTGGGRTADQGEGLINLTIPVKLPHTLEQIIGRGEKTHIKISGREHIAISGQSTISNQFTPNERVQSQSLFPDLNMEQQLEVHLSGQIGEKIIIEVDHNSEVIGPDGTKIRLSYRGDEDEIIQSIETGDVGLTLPGSQLLGYSSNKTGLFGVKVTGQLGAADFTVVASKQKAESASKSFNSKGGEVSDHIIQSSDYLNNRFFRLDLPYIEDGTGHHNPVLGYWNPDDGGTAGHGRDLAAGQYIDVNSIRIFQFVGGGQAQATDETNIAVAIDSSGVWSPGYLGSLTNADWQTGLRWTEIQQSQYDNYTDANGGFIAIDLRQEMPLNALIGVVYTVFNADGTVAFHVGDRPGTDSRGLTIDETQYYRMKVLKPTQPDPYTYQYVLRNIYSLGGTNIDPESFDLRIEAKTSDAQPRLETIDGQDPIDYLRLFGLDNSNGSGGPPDGQPDKTDTYLFDLTRGLLKFPLDFPRPFAAPLARYAAYADLPDSTALTGTGSFIKTNVQPEIYQAAHYNNLDNFARFQIVSSHAAASSSFNLGVTNIEEGSETVTLDGKTLVNGVDYEIDYTFGQITLKGTAADLTADSQISVTYQYAPFFGGGQTNLLGLNLGYDLGQDSKLTTTWLYQSNSIVGYKPKLGEEPSHTLVGNINLQHTLKPYFLTHVANFISRRNSEKESTLSISAETAISIPNPNTRGEVYLEDFEGIDSSDVISLTRLGWSQASRPVHDQDPGFLPRYLEATGDATWGDYTPRNRVSDIRWFLPKNRVLRRYLNPALRDQERTESQQVLELWMQAGADGWTPDTWGGIMRGVSRTGLDLTKTQFLELWVNDGTPDRTQRRGKLHIDFGSISEDFFWPQRGDSLVVGTEQWEDVNRDGVFTNEEDIGLDGQWNADLTHVVSEGEPYDAAYNDDADPFPGINNTARNFREDSEDLNGNTVVDKTNSFFSTTIDLAETTPLVDVDYDYAEDYPNDVNELVGDGIAWRKYRIRLGDVIEAAVDGLPRLNAITHVRIWYEDDAIDAPRKRVLQFSELTFLGSRWERDGIRRVGTEELLPPAERGPNEEFFIGEVNTKENPDYHPAFAVHETNNIPDKEQSIVLDFNQLEPGHQARISKQVSPKGDDYTRYDRLTWDWYNPTSETADVDLFYRVGADTLNYYEVRMRYADTPVRTGWRRVVVNVAELANTKNDSADADGMIRSHIADVVDGREYEVRVVGRPDLRRVKRFYIGVENNTRWNITGYVYMNDVLLKGVKKDIGLANHLGLRLNMADVIKIDFDWSAQDAEYRGLSSDAGQGYSNEDWTLSTNFRLDDFIPLLGFQLPVSLSRHKSVQRPKYVTNSDIEILSADVRNELSTLDDRESFSVRLSHEPSRSAIPRYVIDPWSVQLSGSWTEKTSPLDDSNARTLQGGVNYDLRLPLDSTIGHVPVLGKVPVLKGLSLLPSKISLSGNFAGSERNSIVRDLNGVETPRPSTKTRTGTLAGSADYTAFQIINVGYRNRSERDLLRPKDVLGVNIGEENRYSQDLQVTFGVPKMVQFPSSKVFAPVRAVVKGINELRPSLTFNGGFVDVHDPTTRQPGDPPDVRSVSNSTAWEFRAKVPVGTAFKNLFPENKRTSAEQQRMIEEQRRIEQRDRARGRGQPEVTPPGGAATDSTQTFPGQDEDLTPEERLQREQERLLREAELRAEAEAAERRRRDRAIAPPGGAPADTSGAPADTTGALADTAGAPADTTGAPADTTAAAPGGRPAAWDQVQSTADEGGGGIHIPNPVTPLKNLLRNIGDIQFSYTDRNTSSYSRLVDRAPFLYSIGVDRTLDVPDSAYVAFGGSMDKSLSLATNTQISRKVGLDLKYNQRTGTQNAAGRVTHDYTQDWPDVRLSISGVEEWGIFGGKKTDRTETWFRTSSLDLSYKFSKAVNGYSSDYYNPRRTTTITPRWNFTLQSGMTITLNGTISKDRQTNSGTETINNRWRAGLQVHHQFKAQKILAKLGLYRPGSQPNITMDVDLSYQSNTNERVVPGAATVQAPTGQRTLSFAPRFSYQVSKNLSGAMRLNFDRTSNIATDQTTTSFGLGLEATFVF